MQYGLRVAAYYTIDENDAALSAIMKVGSSCTLYSCFETTSREKLYLGFYITASNPYND